MLLPSMAILQESGKMMDWRIKFLYPVLMRYQEDHMPAHNPLRQILRRLLQRGAFSLFALLWTTSLGGCDTATASDDLAVKYGAPTPPVEDSIQAEYGIPSPIDTMVAKYGVPAPEDSVVAKYGVPPPSPDSMIAKYGAPYPTDTIRARYGCFACDDGAAT